jgi:tetratricopeptide (TPR) repeat protein
MAKGERGEGHPSADELERFLLGEMSPRQAAPVVIHLLTGCGQCRQAMAPLASSMFVNEPTLEAAPQTSGAEYDFPLFKAFAAARGYAAAVGREDLATRRTSELPFLKEVPAPEGRSKARVALSPRERCEALLEQCRSLRHSDPEGMVMTASLAVALAERLDASQNEPAELADLQARAWAELGNAHRVADELPTAEADLAHALDLSSRGTGDPILLARLMDLTASLYIDQRRFQEAHELLDCVYAIYLRMGDQHAAARALISKGVSAGYAFDSEEAVSLLEQGILQADASRDPKLILAAVHNLLWCLLDAGRVDEVGALLHQIRSLYTVHGERFDELRARWLEGRVAAGQDREEEAEQAFLHVREAFKEADLTYDAAIASLDLAALWLHQGRTRETRSLIDEMVGVFRARNIRREALGALLMLREAVQKDQATTALLRSVAREFRRLERFSVRQEPV